MITQMDRNTQYTLQEIPKLQGETHRILVATHEPQKLAHRICHYT